MILCTGPSEKIVVTVSIGTPSIACHVSGVDVDSSSPPVIAMYRKNLTFSVTGTFDLTAPPASGHTLNVKTINIVNTGSGNSFVNVIVTDGVTQYYIWRGSLSPGQTLTYVDGFGWNVPAQPTLTSNNTSLSQQSGTTFTTDTYLTGSDVVFPCAPAIGTCYRIVFDTVKSSGGGTVPIVSVRIGTGVIGDTSRLVFTWAAGTGVADAGLMTVECVFRAVGASAVLQGRASWVTNLTNTGWTVSDKVKLVTSAAFDSTGLTGQRIGVSFDPESFTTTQFVRGELFL